MHSTPVYEPEYMHRFFPLDPTSYIAEDDVHPAFRAAIAGYRHEDLRIISYALRREDFNSFRLVVVWQWRETAKRAWNTHIISRHCMREADCIKMVVSRIEEHTLEIFRDEIETNGHA